MPHDPELTAALMSNRAVLLQAVAHALTLDLAVTPLVLATEPAIGTLTALKGIAEALDMAFSEMRCVMFSDAEHMPQESVIKAVLGQSRPLLLVFDDAMSAGPHIVERMLAALDEQASSPVVVVLTVRLDQEDEAIETIGHALGIHRALVPSARLAVSELLKQPVLLVGALSLEGSRGGERYFEMDVRDAVESRIRFTLKAFGDQWDDELNAFLHNLGNDDVAVRLQNDDGRLTCTTADMEACR